MNNPSLALLALMFRQLGLSRRAAIADADMLNALAQDDDPAARSLLREMASMLALQGSLPDAMAQLPETFSPETVALVRTAEAQGKGGQLFELLADDFALLSQQQRDLWGALAYPAVLLALLVAMMAVLMIFVMPAMKEAFAAFASFGTTLPAPTLFLIAVSDALSGPWTGAALVLAAVAAFVLGKQPAKDRRRAGLRRRWLMHWPVARRYVRQSLEPRIARALMHALSASLPAASVAAHLRATGTTTLEIAALAQLEALLGQGKSTAEALQLTTGMPRRLGAIAALEHNERELPGMLASLADTSLERANALGNRLRRQIGFLAYFVVVLVVAFCVISIYLPIFKLGSVV
jgi:type IV pilus assembly protein PilC